jgi:hypothetical protein
MSRLDPNRRQRDPLAEPFQLTKVNEAAHEIPGHEQDEL